MIVAAHQSMLAPQGAPLPYDAEVEYLESTGTQYIDTGHIPTNDAEISGHFSDVEYPASGSVCLWGARSDSPYRICAMLQYSNRTQNYWGGSASLGSIYITPSDFVFSMSKSGATINSTSISFSGSLSVGTNPIFIFRRSAPSDVSNLPVSHGRVHSFSISESGVLVRNFVPVRIGTTGYLYDRANPTGGPNGNGLYGNAGTGNFTVGPDKT